jgi:N6-adenosine-specific RNA methylase IME4
MKFPNKKYSIIYADPAWNFGNKKTGGSMVSGAGTQYDVMTIDELKKLNVESICSDDCALFMWWVDAMPQEALDLVKAWGFTIKKMSVFDWMKETKTGKPFFGMGFWTRAGSEDCLLAVRGKIRPVSHSVRQVVTAQNTRHSEKPAVVRDNIVDLMGNLPRIELFARQRVDGWDAWGNEL